MSQLHIGMNEMPIVDPEDKFSLHAEVEDKKDIRDQLLYMGMHEASLFPGRDRLSSCITRIVETS